MLVKFLLPNNIKADEKAYKAGEERIEESGGHERAESYQEK